MNDIFECSEQKDNLKHYVACPFLWNPIFANMRLPWAENLLARLALVNPTKDKLLAVAVAFNV